MTIYVCLKLEISR